MLTPNKDSFGQMDGNNQDGTNFEWPSTHRKSPVQTPNLVKRASDDPQHFIFRLSEMFPSRKDHVFFLVFEVFHNFEKHSKYINYQAMLRTWAPVASIVVVVLIVMYFRFRG